MHPFQLLLVGIADTEQYASVIQERDGRIEHIFDADIALAIAAPSLVMHAEAYLGLLPVIGAANLLIERNRKLRMDDIDSERQERMRRMDIHRRHPDIVANGAFMPPAVIEQTIFQLLYGTAGTTQESKRPLHILKR